MDACHRNNELLAEAGQVPALKETAFLNSGCVAKNTARGVLFSAGSRAAVALGSLRIMEEWWQFRQIFQGRCPSASVGDNNAFSITAASCLRVRNLILVGVLVLPLLVFSPSSPLQRFLHPERTDILSTQQHITAWKAGLRMIERHPLFGIGLGNFRPMMRWYAPPGTDWSTIGHNTFLEVAAELGLPALGLFVGILVLTYLSLGGVGRRARIAGDRMMYLATLGLQAGFVGYLVGACLVSAEYTKLFWLVVFLAMCLLIVLSVQRAPQHANPAFSTLSFGAVRGQPGNRRASLCASQFL